jgi:hypothetical protein
MPPKSDLDAMSSPPHSLSFGSRPETAHLHYFSLSNTDSPFGLDQPFGLSGEIALLIKVTTQLNIIHWYAIQESSLHSGAFF